ncbi:DnaJ-domain-containing protein [Punctularia strigosozonata HHB-11173 SS5]|uniref:DnaJ-domain-containing protein n=1 Tax=Punctularia strigosozonata (strain HHB-11173) TaxID=741275 RepID=UPI0004416967|nr:DnaJ-domain-containing protein [Punctularia strigosozonata HHB-11173 SS5]EIN06592.1 DnaJ-domain-containing protein [Punctularia strigosozonata HHB-11173 SS5]
MVSSSASAILRLTGWSYIPDLATRQLLSVFHRVYPNIFHGPAPAPRTPQYVLHYRLTFAVVVLGYLSYNFIEASSTMRPNFYELLGVGPDADETALKQAFRSFARRNHPDRVGSQGEALFVEVRDAYEALKDPIKRFAYDRFGADVLSWSKCTTVREYLRHGLMQASGFHIVTGVILLLMGAVGKPSPVAFWRYILFFALFASELTLLLGPSPSPASSPLASEASISPSGNLLTYLFPRRVPYQHVLFLHQIFMFMSVALSRVAPVLFPGMLDDGKLDTKVLVQMLERIASLTKGLNHEAMMMLHTELNAIHHTDGSSFATPNLVPQPDPAIVETLTKEMENMAIEARLVREAHAGPLKSAWEAAIARGRSALHISSTPATAPVNGYAGKENTAPDSERSPLKRWSSNWWERAGKVAVEDEDVDPPMLPSPSLSPVEGPGERPGVLQEPRLPSPRPSPPPSPWILAGGGRTPVKRKESYTRGRSISY